MPTIFVDFGNTLARFKPAFYEKMYSVLKDYYDNISIDKVFRAYVKMLSSNNFPDEEGREIVDLKDFLYNLGISPREKLIRELEEAKSKDSAEVFLYDDTIEFLETYKAAGYKIILVSNTTKRIQRLLDDLELRKYFDGLVLSFEVKLLKPHPKIFYIGVEKAKEFPLFHVGDIYEIDYLGAKRAGINGILLDRENFYQELKVRKVKSLKELLK